MTSRDAKSDTGGGFIFSICALFLILSSKIFWICVGIVLLVVLIIGILRVVAMQDLPPE